MTTDNDLRCGIHILTALTPLVPTIIHEAYKVEFENGYGASIIVGSVSFGHWELAVTHNGNLCYATPVTTDVVRVNTFSDLEPLLDQLALLPRKDNCTHENPTSNT